MGLKIIAGLFIVFLSTIFGVNFSRKYGRKKEYFTALENFCNYLKREISFSVTPVGTAVKNFVSDNEDLLFTLSSCAFS
ncbi:MAG: hypothetical protein J6Z34_05900, partial [Clostridia bacterium]|nr:hypothetical protein [Clostridia bacterium]